MPIEIGHVEAIFRYPVKSMGGERLEVAKLGWHGLVGRRYGAPVQMMQLNHGIFDMARSLASVDWRSDRPCSSVRRPRKKNVGDRNTMSQP
jgi:hypothetical protein